MSQQVRSFALPLSRRRRTVTTLMTFGLLFLAACGSTSDDPSTAAPEPRTGHLHGLGLDPADGTVYAGGHLGVFRLTGSEAVRVANRCQDTMGFTVSGPRTFLASGHPSATDRTATSPHLGLIRSTDAGNTWTTVSAEGRADFHSLQSAGDMLYGFDSQTSQVWASSDGGATWDRRAQLPIGDLAAHASKPQQLWATTPDGLRTSVDGGHTFTPVPDVPDLVAIDSPDSGVLVALGADGQVLVGDDGRAWTARGRLPKDAEPTVLVGRRELRAPLRSRHRGCGLRVAGRGA